MASRRTPIPVMEQAWARSVLVLFADLCLFGDTELPSAAARLVAAVASRSDDVSFFRSFDHPKPPALVSWPDVTGSPGLYCRVEDVMISPAHVGTDVV